MAYNLGDRFQRDPEYFRFYDPGAYQYEDGHKIISSKFPFLSNTPRNTQSSKPIWTHSLYNTEMSRKIPNITSMMSKIPRFPYEAFSKEDLEAILCKCGFQPPCECPVEEKDQEPEITCQGRVPKHIFIGQPPGSQKFRRVKKVEISPPFYDARVNESTAFYQGCKWSKWSGNRNEKSLHDIPGPAHYTVDRQPTEIELCAEKVRAEKRKTSKQYRFIEMVQRKNILEGAPSPATYTPMEPKGTELQYLGSKADRFPMSQYDISPGPADHWLKRDFDLSDPPQKPSRARLPEPACFGMKAQRFRPRRDEGPSPASYDSNYKPCQFVTCPKTPFGSATVRFKPDPIEESDEEEDVEKPQNEESNKKEPCPSPTWQFRSKTVRMKLEKKTRNSRSIGIATPKSKMMRSWQLQYIAPFLSSEGRFQPWCNYIPVFGKQATPGPCYYNLEKPKCVPAVNRGPLCRSPRFQSPLFQSPAPNEYTVGGGVETVLNTHNQNLRKNIDNQHSFNWKPPVEPRKLTIEQREIILLNKCIALCEPEPEDNEQTPTQPQANDTDKDPLKKKEQKLLSYFLYTHQIPSCF